MTTAAEWRERRRLLVAQATLERVRMAHDVFRLRGLLPRSSAGPVLALAVGAAVAFSRRLRGRGTLLRRVLRAWRAWRRERR